MPLFRAVDFGEKCCRCGAGKSVIKDTMGDPRHDAHVPLWVCQVCEKHVCRACTLVNPKTKTYYGMTLCSEECRLVHLTEFRMTGEGTDPEEDEEWND